MLINCSLRNSCVGFISFFLLFLLWSIFIIFMGNMFYVCLLFINNDPMKGQVSSFPSCFINNYLTPLLLSPHPRQSSFRHGIDKVLGI